ncbi:hypothetical protein GPECTOR_2g1423 [Gonium pectorale]|uniref:Endoplasmic reticulum transmembrane protein n=1 Tax=Gonium pectorale TaxID=33097 RepID=A0A150H1M6_GONPE|nr:hypothetical protein GPECTOR_2g1423 [Gonium pectorale]|eukprot:KXZ55872.1 hypothetical protein GPECTOR_2g1423 [Gonium pectorale]
MQRQVKGLQAEYERVTSAPKADAKGGDLAAEEAAALKKTVDRLIAEKEALHSGKEAAEAAAKTAEARVTAMVAQIKGFDKEFDRLLDENKALKKQVAAAQATGGGGGHVDLPSKKDD